MCEVVYGSGAGTLRGDSGRNGVSFDAVPSTLSFCRSPLKGPRSMPPITLCYLLLESVSRHLVGFDVLNNNLIKGLISFVKYMGRF
jgi:hypothetical protein